MERAPEGERERGRGREREREKERWRSEGGARGEALDEVARYFERGSGTNREAVAGDAARYVDRARESESVSASASVTASASGASRDSDSAGATAGPQRSMRDVMGLAFDSAQRRDDYRYNHEDAAKMLVQEAQDAQRSSRFTLNAIMSQNREGGSDELMSNIAIAIAAAQLAERASSRVAEAAERARVDARNVDDRYRAVDKRVIGSGELPSNSHNSSAERSAPSDARPSEVVARMDRSTKDRIDAIPEIYGDSKRFFKTASSPARDSTVVMDASEPLGESADVKPLIQYRQEPDGAHEQHQSRHVAAKVDVGVMDGPQDFHIESNGRKLPQLLPRPSNDMGYSGGLGSEHKEIKTSTIVAESAAPKSLRVPRGPAKQVSKSCHVCGHAPRNRRTMTCSRFESGECRKIYCEKCLLRLMSADEAEAVLWSEAKSVCFHCRGACPAWAQCTYYGRANAKRRPVKESSEPTPNEPDAVKF